MNVPDPIVLGTRGSQLALWQANYVRSKLESRGHRVQIETIQTRGDQVQDVPISQIGDEAVFTKELDLALLSGDIHVAVHSLKDLPSVLPDGIALSAISERAIPFDAFVPHQTFDGRLEDLPEGAVIATASLRRKAHLKSWRPDLEIVPVRGNVDTRIEKLDASDWHGMVLAVAGLHRLGFSARVREHIDPAIMVPAVGQGALGVACASEATDVQGAVRDALHHEPTAAGVRAERAFLREIGGGCQVPMGAWGHLEDDEVHVDACIAALDGSDAFREHRTCAPEDAEATGTAIAQSLLEQGGAEIVDEILGDRSSRTASFRP